ncbi:MAG TPA: MAPEG family protein, partial [Alphaproteobacteria bacterium]|nr:MAPEG family protein [Alphaproteobacteria bacterium]
PLALILLLAVEVQGFSAAVVHVLGSVLVIGRALHAFGLSRHHGTSFGRAAGILLTWVMILIASVLAIYSVILPGRF